MLLFEEPSGFLLIAIRRLPKVPVIKFPPISENPVILSLSIPYSMKEGIVSKKGP